MSKKYSAPALEKGLDIVELLSCQETGMTQAEIARSLDRSVSEIFRMLMVLMDREYVALNPTSDRYQLTSLIFEIANRTPIVKRLSSIANPVMRKFSEDVNQSIHIGVLSGNSVTIIAQKDSPGYNVLSVKLGARVEALSASSGWAILANLPEQDLNSYLSEHSLPKGLSKSELLDKFDAIRTRGYEINASLRVRGVTDVSAAIFDHSLAPIAALTTPYIERLDQLIPIEKVVEKLSASAAEISRQIGGAHQIKPPQTAQ